MENDEQSSPTRSVGESALAEALETLHLDPFCDGRCKPTAPRLLDALGACPKLRDVDGVRCPESGSHPTLALLNRFVVNPTDLAKRHAAAPKLRELVVVGDKPYDFTHWSVSAPQLATFKLWGATLVSLVREPVSRSVEIKSSSALQFEVFRTGLAM